MEASPFLDLITRFSLLFFFSNKLSRVSLLNTMRGGGGGGGGGALGAV